MKPFGHSLVKYIVDVYANLQFSWITLRRSLGIVRLQHNPKSEQPTDGFWTGARPTPCLWNCVLPTGMVSGHDGCLSYRVWTKTSPSDTPISPHVPIFIKRSRDANSFHIRYQSAPQNYPIFSRIFTHKSRSQPGQKNNKETSIVLYKILSAFQKSSEPRRNQN